MAAATYVKRKLSQQPMRLLALIFCLLVAPFSSADSFSRGHVQFRLEAIPPTKGEPEETTWLATYGSNAKFLISLPSQDSSNSLFSSSKGTIRHVSGSDARPLLSALVEALGAKGIPRASKKTKALTFDVAIFGTKETHHSDGSFGNRPPGNWIVSKIFLADGEGEVFLNLDPVLGIGEFALKDPEYGEVVIRELASVL